MGSVGCGACQRVGRTPGGLVGWGERDGHSQHRSRTHPGLEPRRYPAGHGTSVQRAPPRVLKHIWLGPHWIVPSVHSSTSAGREGTALGWLRWGCNPHPPTCAWTLRQGDTSTDCGELRLGATILRKEKDLQPQKDDIQGTMGTGHSPGSPALTVAGFPVGQQPVASGAEAAVAARAVPALVLALVQCLTLVEIYGMRGVKAREEDQSPLVPLPWASLALTSPSQHSKNHRAQSGHRAARRTPGPFWGQSNR